jgi:pyruvate/2-oxoglutarate dehydrogenase complex dihydrolipoamide dehydrogenase (E3) component
MDRFDLAVIGAGSAGLSLTAVAAQLGVRVALIERDRMGGDCLNVGCVPSKALLAASHAARSARGAARFGVHLPEPVIDWASVRAHVQGAIATIAPNDSEERFRRLGATVLRGTARFTAADRLVVDGRAIAAKRIVVAAGSRPAVPALPGLEAIPYLTNETLFELEQRPRHLVILGGGPLGLEMAQAHAGLGSIVTLVTAGALAPREDPELVEGLRAALQADGITIIEDAVVTGAEPGPCLVLADGRRVAGSHLLVATGRRPSLAPLGLEPAGVRTTPAGIATDAGLRSLTARHVFAAGDIADPAGIGPRRFTHVGSYHAGILVRRLLFRLPARIDYAALPRVTYTDPELAQVGLTEAEAAKAGHAPRVLRWHMAENDRAIAEGRTDGMIKLVVGKSGRLLGAGMLAPGAGEMIGLWALAIGREIPLSAVANMVLPYPTRAEAGKRAAGSLFGPRLFAGRTRMLVRALSVLP